jgi:hypothetical protein
MVGLSFLTVAQQRLNDQGYYREMAAADRHSSALTLVTLGPEGTCHERACRAYMDFQGIDDYGFDFISDFLVGLDRIRGRSNALLVQCSAHPKVDEVTERYWKEVFVVDTFIYPTKHLAGPAEPPRRRVPALDRNRAGDQGLHRPLPLGGGRRELEAGRRRRTDARRLRLRADAPRARRGAPDLLQLDLDIGEIDTTWVVYGTSKRFDREVIGIPSRPILQREAA